MWGPHLAEARGLPKSDPAYMWIKQFGVSIFKCNSLVDDPYNFSIVTSIG